MINLCQRYGVLRIHFRGVCIFDHKSFQNIHYQLQMERDTLLHETGEKLQMIIDKLAKERNELLAIVELRGAQLECERETSEHQFHHRSLQKQREHELESTVTGKELTVKLTTDSQEQWTREVSEEGKDPENEEEKKQTSQSDKDTPGNRELGPTDEQQLNESEQVEQSVKDKIVGSQGMDLVQLEEKAELTRLMEITQSKHLREMEKKSDEANQLQKMLEESQYMLAVTESKHNSKDHETGQKISGLQEMIEDLSDDLDVLKSENYELKKLNSQLQIENQHYKPNVRQYPPASTGPYPSQADGHTKSLHCRPVATTYRSGGAYPATTYHMIPLIGRGPPTTTSSHEPTSHSLSSSIQTHPTSDSSRNSLSRTASTLLLRDASHHIQPQLPVSLPQSSESYAHSRPLSSTTVSSHQQLYTSSASYHYSTPGMYSPHVPVPVTPPYSSSASYRYSIPGMYSPHAPVPVTPPYSSSASYRYSTPGMYSPHAPVPVTPPYSSSASYRHSTPGMYSPHAPEPVTPSYSSSASSSYRYSTPGMYSPHAPVPVTPPYSQGHHISMSVDHGGRVTKGEVETIEQLTTVVQERNLEFQPTAMLSKKDDHDTVNNDKGKEEQESDEYKSV